MSLWHLNSHVHRLVCLCIPQGIWALGRKDMLVKTIARARRTLGSDYFPYLPETYTLPADASLLEARMADAARSAALTHSNSTSSGNGSNGVLVGGGVTCPEAALPLWIAKPASSSCGRGIRVVTKFAEVDPSRLKAPKASAAAAAAAALAVAADGGSEAEAAAAGTAAAAAAVAAARGKKMVVSRYIANPYLIGGKKFDMRIYVFISSFSPLKVYLYGEGLARYVSHVTSLQEAMFTCNSCIFVSLHLI